MKLLHLTQTTLHALLLILSILLFSPISVGENRVLEIIPLQHRMAEEVLPILKPLINEGGTLTGMNNQLIIRTSPTNLQELKQVLSEIDRAQRSLRIHVQFSDQSDRLSRGSSGSVQYRTRSLDIDTGEPSWRDVKEWRDDQHPPQGRRLPVPHDDINSRASVRYRTWQTDSQQRGESTYFVRTLEGRSAWIRTGENVPFVSRNIVLYPYGHDVIDTIDYIDISAGFYVKPMLNGERVNLFISPQQDQLSPHSADRIQTRGAEMSVSGQLGQWIDLGGVSDEYDQNGSGLLTRNRNTGQQSWHIWVMVEELD